MSLTSVLDKLHLIGAVVTPVADGRLRIVTPTGTFTAALREQVLARKPAVRAVVAWDAGDAARLLSRLRALIEQARPADFPARPSAEWTASAFHVEVAHVTRDMLGLIYAAQAHLHFAYAAFGDWDRLRRWTTGGNTR